MRKTIIRSGTVLAALAAASCAPPTPGASDSPSAGSDTAAETQPVRLQAEVTRLEARLREIARSEGCAAAAQCRTAPVGERACGGPREYLVYCATTTDEAQLLAVADSLKQAEMRLNEATGAVSTCELRIPPDVAVSAGRCEAVGTRE